jgi:hypothetical protein
MSSKISSPNPPVRYCRRCGELITWKDPEGWEYDEITGNPLMIKITGNCRNMVEDAPGPAKGSPVRSNGWPHTHLELYWVTQNRTGGEAISREDMTPEHWYHHDLNYMGLKIYCDIHHLEAFANGVKNKVIQQDIPKKRKRR